MLTEYISFESVDLQDSIVLSWLQRSSSIEVTLEASLLPRHPLYLSPKPGERSCFRRAVLAFRNVREVDGLLQMSEVEPSVDSTGADYDTLHVLGILDDRYYLEGEFGEVSIVSDPPTLSFGERTIYDCVRMFA